jgi:hypothetical protein
VQNDRRHCHASGKGERKGHSYEYLCHADPWTSLQKQHHAEYPDVVPKGEYLLEFSRGRSLNALRLRSLTANEPCNLEATPYKYLAAIKIKATVATKGKPIEYPFFEVKPHQADAWQLSGSGRRQSRISGLLKGSPRESQ